MATGFFYAVKIGFTNTQENLFLTFFFYAVKIDTSWIYVHSPKDGPVPMELD